MNPIEPWTLDSAWYNTLPVFEKYGVKLPSRKYFKAQIRVVCEKLGFTREQLGIVAAPWATMYYNGIWTGVSFDAVNSLATKGTDIIFIEKLDLVRVFAKYADKFGLALVNSHGHLVEYAKDLTKAAEASGAHVSIATDYDIPGVLIASEAKGVAWLGVNEKMLQYFDLAKHNKSVVVSYNPKKKRIDPDDFRNLVESDERFTGLADIDFLKKNKIELDAILAAVGSEELWKYLIERLKESYPTRDYNRVISSRPSLLYHYPQSIKNLVRYMDNHIDSLISKEREKIEAELKDVEGFIEVEKRKEEIDKRLGDVVEADPRLRKMGLELEELMRKEGYDISEVQEPDGSDFFGW
jgi:uncharacterized protein with HEPN domain